MHSLNLSMNNNTLTFLEWEIDNVLAHGAFDGYDLVDKLVKRAQLQKIPTHPLPKVVAYPDFPKRVRNFVKDYFYSELAQFPDLISHLGELKVFASVRPSHYESNVGAEYFDNANLIASYVPLEELFTKYAKGLVHEITHSIQFYLYNRGRKVATPRIDDSRYYSDNKFYLDDVAEVVARKAEASFDSLSWMMHSSPGVNIYYRLNQDQAYELFKKGTSLIKFPAGKSREFILEDSEDGWRIVTDFGGTFTPVSNYVFNDNEEALVWVKEQGLRAQSSLKFSWMQQEDPIVEVASTGTITNVKKVLRFLPDWIIQKYQMEPLYKRKEDPAGWLSYTEDLGDIEGDLKEFGLTLNAETFYKGKGIAWFATDIFPAVHQQFDLSTWKFIELESSQKLSWLLQPDAGGYPTYDINDLQAYSLYEQGTPVKDFTEEGDHLLVHTEEGWELWIVKRNPTPYERKMGTIKRLAIDVFKDDTEAQEWLQDQAEQQRSLDASLKFSALKDKNEQLFNQRYQNYGEDGGNLFWSDKQSQYDRFELLTDVADLSTINKASILDVGAGFGDYLDFLRDYSIIVGKYVGIDIIPAIIEVAERKHPLEQFEVRDLIREPYAENSFDYVIGSGLFALDDKNWLEETASLLKAMYNASRKAVSVNFLIGASVSDMFKTVSEEEVEKIASSITDKFKIIKDKISDDITLYLYKEQ